MKVLKIGAEWCSGCIIMAPRWKKIEENNPWLETYYYDYDKSPEIIEKYSMQEANLPTFIFLDKNDNEILRLSGEISEKELLETINKNKDK